MTVLKGTCPLCHREVSVKLDGTLKQHRSDPKVHRNTCQGSGLPPLGPWPRHHGPLAVS